MGCVYFKCDGSSWLCSSKSKSSCFGLLEEAAKNIANESEKLLITMSEISVLTLCSARSTTEVFSVLHHSLKEKQNRLSQHPLNMHHFQSVTSIQISVTVEKT